ncbi:MAG TPA: iron-sulfur cluster assembly accessory protein [Acidobacteriota bacterium]|nr:iron-sulfur cluster assembly accessory protein [Acidobacteriota bacterium]
MVTLTEKAVSKVKNVIASQSAEKVVSGIRIAVVGGGCSGFQYAMNLESQARPDDKVLDFGGLNVFVDEQSLLYLDGTEIDYVETLHGAGFKFNNPNVKGTCGCGESFQA